MSLSVSAALRDGLGRTFERNGLQLIVLFVGLRLVTTVADDSLRAANRELADQVGVFSGAGPGGVLSGVLEAPTPYALDIGVGPAAALVAAVALLAEAVRIVAVRTLVSDAVATIPADYWRRNIGVATLNGFVGGIVVLTLTAIGLVVLVVPGVFLALSFFFVRQEIAVRDVNFVEAMSGSWELTSGSRVDLLVLGAVVVLLGLVATIPAAILGAFAPAAGATAAAVLRGIVEVFGVAAAARAYVQLTEAAAADPEEPDPYAGALGPDDLPQLGDDEP